MHFPSPPSLRLSHPCLCWPGSCVCTSVCMWGREAIVCQLCRGLCKVGYKPLRLLTIVPLRTIPNLLLQDSCGGGLKTLLSCSPPPSPLPALHPQHHLVPLFPQPRISRLLLFFFFFCFLLFGWCISSEQSPQKTSACSFTHVKLLCRQTASRPRL